jgi:hypothetical protein
MLPALEVIPCLVRIQALQNAFAITLANVGIQGEYWPDLDDRETCLRITPDYNSQKTNPEKAAKS